MGKLIAGAAAISILIPGAYLIFSHLFIIALAYKGRIDPWLGFAAIPFTVFAGAMLMLLGLHIGARYGVWHLPGRKAD